MVNLIYTLFDKIYSIAGSLLEWIHGDKWVQVMDRIWGTPSFSWSWQQIFGSPPPTILEILVGGGLIFVLVWSLVNFFAKIIPGN